MTLPADHVCSICEQPSTTVQHPSCRLPGWTETPEAAQLRAEFTEAVTAIQAGQMARVSDACMSVYGAQIKKQRELAAKKRGGRRDTSSV